jgi:hypothetical protein
MAVSSVLTRIVFLRCSVLITRCLLRNVCSYAGQQSGPDITGPATTATAQATGGPAAGYHGLSFSVPRNHQQFNKILARKLLRKNPTEQKNSNKLDNLMRYIQQFGNQSVSSFSSSFSL